MEPREEPILKQLAMFSWVLSQFLGSSAVGVGLGYWLWKKQGLPWWVLLLTSALGIYAASYQVYRYQNRLNARAAQNKESE